MSNSGANLAGAFAPVDPTNWTQGKRTFTSRRAGTSPIAAVVPEFNVLDFGAKGDGSTDDTAALQACFTAAAAQRGKVKFPVPTAGHYKITDTISITSPDANALHLDVEMLGYHNSIRWAGANNKSVFSVQGLQMSDWHGVKVNINDGITGVVIFDLDTTLTLGSLHNVKFTTCFAGLGNGTGNVGWRVGHVSGGGGDLSFIGWDSCYAAGGGGSAPVTGQRGWIIEGGNALAFSWWNCFGSYLDKLLTNLSDAGASNVQGGGCCYWFGGGGGFNNTDFEVSNIGAWLISGGRFEWGHRFMSVGPTSGSNHFIATVQGVTISEYAPSDEKVVNVDRPGTLIWTGNYVFRSSGDHTTACLSFPGGFTGRGNLQVRGGAVRAAQATAFYTAGTNINVHIEGVGAFNSSRQTTTYFADRLGQSNNFVAITYAASMTPDITQGSHFEINATDTAAFTINNPAVAVGGRRVVVDILNSSGGAMGAITWGAAFALAGAFTNPASTKRRTIEFVYNSRVSKWVEVSRAAADI